MTVIVPQKTSVFYHINTDGSPGNGWSETIHLNVSSVDAALAALTVLIPARLALSTDDVTFDGARVSNALDRYKDRVFDSTALGIVGIGTYDPAAESPARVVGTMPADMALCLRVSTLEDDHTSVFMHGIPRASVLGNLYAPGTIYNANFATWLSAAKLYYAIKVVNVVNTYNALNAIDSTSVTSRKTGRPFGFRAGRRFQH